MTFKVESSEKGTYATEVTVQVPTEEAAFFAHLTWGFPKFG